MLAVNAKPFERDVTQRTETRGAKDKCYAINEQIKARENILICHLRKITDK